MSITHCLYNPLLIRTIITYHYIPTEAPMFILEPTFSIFSILSAKIDTNFPIPSVKNQILSIKKPFNGTMNKVIPREAPETVLHNIKPKMQTYPKE